MKKLTASAGTKSRLAKPVQELIRMIFDVESMKKAMVEFEVGRSLKRACADRNVVWFIGANDEIVIHNLFQACRWFSETACCSPTD